MATTKKIYQASSNSPVKDTVIFSGKNVVQLGIQATAGMKFKINDETEFLIGSSGIYEINVEEFSSISSLELTDLGSATSKAYIIDYVNVE